MLNPLDPSTLAAARQRAGLSVGRLSEISGIHKTTIIRIERGEVDPHVQATWAKLVRAVEGAAPSTHPKAAGRRAA